MYNFFQYLANRAQEPSTYAGIAALAAAAGYAVDPGVIQMGAQAVAGLAGIAAVSMRDHGAKGATGATVIK